MYPIFEMKKEEKDGSLKNTKYLTPPILVTKSDTKEHSANLVIINQKRVYWTLGRVNLGEKSGTFVPFLSIKKRRGKVAWFVVVFICVFLGQALLR